MSMYKCPYCDEWMDYHEMHRPCPTLVTRVNELKRALNMAIGECAKVKDDLRKLEDETQWSEATLVVDGKDVGIRMRGSMFVLKERSRPVTVTSRGAKAGRKPWEVG